MEEPIIQVTDLVKKYGEFSAVDNISISVKTGEIFAFLGPNGAGKTTTIKMLTTLLVPTSGQIILNGYDPVREQDAARRSFGIVFQDPSLDNELTAYENMILHGVLYSMPKNSRDERTKMLLELVQLWDRKDELVKKFSGGMKRRLEIARGLLHLPQIFFLDEPTLGLDPQTRNLLWEHIRELNQKENITVFFTTHMMEEAERSADTVAVIDHGKIIAQGSPKELAERTGTKSLEEAFLALTGKEIREEEAENKNRMVNKMMRGRW
ncbi:ABC transporter ATP-binding protein [Candidatus Contubernalis alkalaceticus]|uniref:ABC transporter ATP-binding protein n=1 Tax=Candidatus Contubernalis alkaliaceticus TaxID=338645 RepID=UPI0029622787|nr:ATP-binding cassette domain-containing protein [Candidatus Contubernalis alkalaceticus]